jgi:RNA polymerase sigma-70 factor (ECF subfamily)
MRMRRVGPYQLQAAIASLHDEAAASAATDWAQIAALYRILGEMQPSPVVELNRAVAVAMADGPEAGLVLVDRVAATGQLDDYPYLHSTRADLLRRLGRRADAAEAYQAALALTANEPERAFLAGRIAALGRATA